LLRSIVLAPVSGEDSSSIAILDAGETHLSWFNTLGIAVGLAMDALAVAIAAGLIIPRLTNRHIFRLAFHFALFQLMMPIIGWSIGRTVSSLMGSYDHWVAFGLLAAIGGKMLWEAATNRPAEDRGDPTRGWKLITLSIATSVDALAVGLSLAFLQASIWTPSAVIGLVTAGLTAIGMRFGNRIGRRFGTLAEVVGGVVLIGIGVRILISHLASR
jgi:putative Mn2+ efflux pump MntP